MNVYPCKFPVCPELVTRRGDCCPAHGGERRRERAERDRHYDRHLRNPEAKRFYNSRTWQRCRADKLAAFPVCQHCERTPAAHVHHVVPLDRCTVEQRTDPDNLMSVCPPCHNTLEAEMRGLGC